MLIVISPAKKLDSGNRDWPPHYPPLSQPQQLAEARQLIAELQQLSPAEVGGLMKLSDKLAALNYSRFQQWAEPLTPSSAQPALFAFQGDVYQGLNAQQLSVADLHWAQQHLRILSGLYGVLRPLDLMLPYRLEMGTKFTTARGTDLYQFWGDSITAQLNDSLAEQAQPLVVNLASNEYFRAVKPAHLQAEVVTPQFYDRKNGQYKIISFYAKRARGAMAAFIIQNRCRDSAELNAFDADGYRYHTALSSPQKPAFCRELE